MKRNVFIGLFLCAVISIEAQIQTPALSPAAKLTQTVGLTEITVEYSRPSMRGRKIFGNLVPYNKLWRTGANARTKITLSDDVTISGDTLKKGVYAIFTIPKANSWDVIFYNEADGSGSIPTLNDNKIALQANVPTEEIPVSIETFTISFDDLKPDGGTLGFMWENTYVGVKIAVPSEARAMASIESVMNGPSANDYYNAASYFRSSGKDLKRALTWITKATELNKNAFWMFREKSLIHAALGDKKAAIEAAEKSLAIAEKYNNADYIKMNKESIAQWRK